MEKTKLSPRQKDTLEIIKEFIRGGYPPTIEEIQEKMGISSNAVRNHIKALVRKMYVSRTSGARTLKVLS